MHTQTVSTDILVVGGGLAGVGAAVAAARLGKTVALVNNRPILGGNSSSEVRVWVCGATAHGNQRWARESGVMGEMFVENQYRNPEGNPVYWDDVVLDLVHREPNISLFLNTDVREVSASGPEDGRRVESVTAWTMGSELLTTFVAPFVIDASGDGLIGHLAGARYRLGKEARSEFDEPWAPDEAVREFLGSTLLFYTRDMGFPVKFVAPESTIDIADTPIPLSRVIHSGDSGAHYWWIEYGGTLDIVDDNEHIRDELRGVINGVWDYIKNSGQFDADTLTMDWIGNIPGKREYRRFIGDYTLTQNDVMSQARFDDGVAFGGWSIDLHPAEGMYSAGAGAVQRFSNGVFEIPYRCLYSANVTNLFMAGRDFSATHVAFGAARVMGTCASMGEAAGTAAAMCLDLDTTPRGLYRDHMPALRQCLLRQDASLIGVRNEDPRDLARVASVSASSHRRHTGTHAPDGTALARVRDEARLRLDADQAIVLPVDPQLDCVHLRLRTLRPTTLNAELWSPDLPQNSVPVTLVTAARVPLPYLPEPTWIPVALPYRPDSPSNAIIVLRANPHVEALTTSQLPPGVLTLTHSPDSNDQNVSVDTESPLLRWPTKPLRGRSIQFASEPPTLATTPDKAVGGYQRPFGGPNMWTSEPLSEPEPEWLRLDWDRPLIASEVRIVFDADVDLDLITLHHHRTSCEIIPTLVKRYRIEVLTEPTASWTTIAFVDDNRHRQRVHSLSEAGSFTALRVVVESTNGAPEARVVSLRVQE